jgi:hypothetical protein
MLGCLLTATMARGQQPVAMRVAAPELKAVSDWINSGPLKLADWRGQVVVVHFYAFG